MVLIWERNLPSYPTNPCFEDFFLISLQFALGQNAEKALRTGTLATVAKLVGSMETSRRNWKVNQHVMCTIKPQPGLNGFSFLICPEPPGIRSPLTEIAWGLGMRVVCQEKAGIFRARTKQVWGSKFDSVNMGMLFINAR